MSTIFYVTAALSIISVVQALVLAKRGKACSAHKYLTYSLVFILLNLPILSNHFEVCLVAILMLKIILASDTDELNSVFIYVSDLLVITLVALKPYHLDHDLVSTCAVLSWAFIPLLVRVVLDKNILTPLYIMPAILLASITDTQISTAAICVYTLTLFLLYRYNKEKLSILFVCLMLVAFFDGNIIQNIVSGLTESMDHKIALAILFILSASRLMEKYIKRISVIIDFKMTLVVVFGASAIFFPPLMSASFKITQPVPLVLGVIFILVNYRYLRVFRRTRLYAAWDLLVTLSTKSTQTLHGSAKNVKIWLRSFCEKFISGMNKHINTSVIKTRVTIHNTLVWISANFVSVLSVGAVKLELLVERTGYKEGLAVASTIIIILIILFGVLL